ncbi:hypothetical protein TNCV_4807601 [Trichonephila clavipes]|nr:hypothetical protein TNCV_4807601 [Trichonephila clavipes]
MFDSSSYDNPTPLAHADASRDVFRRGAPHQVALQYINILTVQSTAKLPTRLPKMMPTWLYRQHFAMFSLNRRYNVRKGVSCATLTLQRRDQLRKVFSKINPQESYGSVNIKFLKSPFLSTIRPTE